MHNKIMEFEENVRTSALDHFSEVKEVYELLDQSILNCHDDILMEADLEKITVILDQYQEQPHLLDPYLDDFISKLLNTVKDSSTPKKAFHQSFKYLYLFTKVRGYKQTLRLFTHEVADLEFVLKLLCEQSPIDYQTWETRYILLLWLAIVCIIPFDLSRLDGGSNDEQDKSSILNRILSAALPYLEVCDKSKDAAAYLTAKFLTRPDVKSIKLPEFIEWSLNTIRNADRKSMVGMNVITGSIATLALIFKHGRREDLLPFASKVFDCVESLKIIDIENTLIRKLAVKLVQRVGLVFLPPRVATWRYLRGNRSLSQNLSVPGTNISAVQSVQSKSAPDLQEEDFDIPEEVESVLEFLMTGLKDKDTIVRWSAAKGVGRMTARLPEELADEVVESLLELFSFSELDGAWHGGCLALAELGRRGLLLPSRLTEVVPIVLKALMYDERRGSYSVGSHVRDAACYVCWSFARAYEPQQIKPYVLDIAISLLVVTVFDREVNCRRAASAAVQEHVGRQGTFPHGIDIVTTADYFAVGSRTNCYTNLSVYIAGFSEYTHPLIDHLIRIKISHWDSVIRELTSKALSNLTATAPDYMQDTVLPLLAEQTSSVDICTKHGAILALAEVIHALFLQTADGKVFQLESRIMDVIKKLTAKLRSSNQFRGYGGELMRKAACKLIEKMAVSKIQLDDPNVLRDWLFVIEDTIPHTEPTVQEYAIKALTPFCLVYIQDSSDFDKVSVVNKYCEKLKSTLKFDRMGFALAIGALPYFMLDDIVRSVVCSLRDCCKVGDNKLNAGLYAEGRQNSVNALSSICQTIGLSGSLAEHVNDIYDCFLTSMEDYTMDSRGDVGAWVREAAMSSLVGLTYLVVEQNISVFNESICSKIMCCLVQQAAEKIDRTRAHAGNLLLKSIHHEPSVPFIPHKEELLNILPSSLINTLNWAAPAEGFTTITKLLPLAAYQYPVLLGLVVSTGGLTESLIRHSSDCLLEFLSEHQENENSMDDITNNILKILKAYPKDYRVVVPLFKTLDLLLTSGCLELYNDEEKSCKFPLKLLLAVKEEVKSCGDAKKVLASINVFCGLLQFPGDVRKGSLQHIMLLLCHRYPRIRKATAEQFYTTLLTFEDIISEEHVDDVITKLTDIAWDDSLGKLRPIRNQICVLFNIPPPKLKANARNTVVTKVVDNLDSYKDLVTRHGF